jgi:hypothetical protein
MYLLAADRNTSRTGADAALDAAMGNGIVHDPSRLQGACSGCRSRGHRRGEQRA